MDKITEYLSSNPKYVIALIITAVALLAACVLGYFVKKYDLLKFMDRWSKKKKAEGETDRSEQAEIIEDQAQDEQISATEDAHDGANLEEPASAEEVTDSGEKQLISQEAQDSQTAPIEPKQSRLSQMLKKSLEEDAAALYEEEKRLNAQQKQPVIEKKEETQPLPEPPKEPEYEGKWRILRVGSTYVAQLHNDADLLLLRSEKHSSISGVKTAIETLKKHIKSNNFTIAVMGGKYVFKLFTPSDRLVCVGQPCESRSECIARIEEIKKLAFTAEIIKG